MQHQLSGNTASHQTATFTKHIFCRISNTKVEIFMTSFNLSLCDLHCQRKKKKKQGLKALYNETDKNQQQPRFSLAHLRLASFTALHRSVSENGASKCLHAEFACYHTTKTFLCVFTANL